MDGLSARLEGARSYWLTLWGAIAQLLQHGAVVERIYHVDPGCLVKGLDQLMEFLRMLIAHIDRLRKVFVEVVQGPVIHVDGYAALLQRACQPPIPVVSAIRPALVVLLSAR